MASKKTSSGSVWDDLPELDHLQPDELGDILGRVLVDSTLPVLRDACVVLLRARYAGSIDTQVLGTPAYGELLLCGPNLAYDTLLCVVEVTHGSKRAVIQDPASPDCDQLRAQGVVKGARLRMAAAASADEFVHTRGLKEDAAAGQTYVQLKDAFRDPDFHGGGPPAPRRRQLFGKSTAFMDRQTSGRSFAASAYVQTHLQRGDPSQWDLSLVLWLLLNSGHDGQDSEECRGLLHAISSLQAGCTISEADADARTAAARTALAELRTIRNTLEGHKLKWRCRTRISRAPSASVSASWGPWTTCGVRAGTPEAWAEPRAAESLVSCGVP